MYKIFVHEICQIIGNGQDRDKEFYSTIQKKTRIYCNCQDCFDNIRFWKVLDELKSIVCSAQGTYDHYGYIGDYDKNHCREKANDKLANYICDKLNNACDKKMFEPYYLGSYKHTQIRAWDTNYYWAPWDSECRYDITDIFLNNISIENKYLSYLENIEYEGHFIYQEEKKINLEINDINHKIWNLEKQISELKKQITTLENERRHLWNDDCSVHRDLLVRLKCFLKFMVPYIEATFDKVNEPIRMYPSLGVSFCNFINEEGKEDVFYPINVAFALKDKLLLHKLIENGACKFSKGTFRDQKKNTYIVDDHNLERICFFCDKPYIMIFKENSINNGGLYTEFANLDSILEGFYIVKIILREVFPAERVNYCYNLSYLAILADDKYNRLICRLKFNKAQKEIGFFNTKDIKDEWFPIANLDEIYQYQDRIREAALKYL